MLRLILWLVFIYLFFKLLKLVFPILQAAWRVRQQVRSSTQRDSQQPPIDLSKIKDAEFEELPNEPPQKKDEKQA